MFIERSEAIATIRKSLKARSGKAWSVRGDHGTAYGWIHITAPTARLTCDFEGGAPCIGAECPRCARYSGAKQYLSAADRSELQELLGEWRPAHPQGVSISPDRRETYVAAALGPQSEPAVIVRGGCAHVLVGERQCRSCEAALAAKEVAK